MGLIGRRQGGGVNIVAIDDDPSLLEFYKAALEGSGARVETATDAEQGLDLVAALAPELVFVDLVMPGAGGMEVLRRIRKLDPLSRVVMVTGHYSIETAVEAIREGATDYVCKPIKPDKLREIVEQARAAASRQHRAEELEKELVEVSNLEGIVGRSPSMLEMFDLVQRIAPHFRTALILGETGTGKELVARALHSLSPRRKNRFAVCNCAAVVESLMESQLFGHTKGSFTGATDEKPGLFEWADHGAVFLDEVGELGLQMQSKLLRVLENDEVQKVGAPQPRKVDVLMIAATSRDLNQEVQTGKFRADLWYRLNMIEIRLPPLRERKDDLSLLTRHFLRHYNQQYGKQVEGVSRRAMDMFLAYSWPGNVRELENVIGRACLLTRGHFLDVEDFPELRARNASPAAAGAPTALEEAEKATLIRVLSEARNKALAARMLGVSRPTLYRLMEKYGLKEEKNKA